MNVLSQKITHFTVFFIGGFPKWKIAQNCTFLGKKVKFGIILRRNCQNFMEE